MSTFMRAAKRWLAWSRGRGVGIGTNWKINPMQSKLPMHTRSNAVERKRGAPRRANRPGWLTADAECTVGGPAHRLAIETIQTRPLFGGGDIPATRNRGPASGNENSGGRCQLESTTFSTP